MGGDATIESNNEQLYYPKLPEHWQRCSLYSMAEWVNGLAFRNIHFSSKGMPVIKIAEIKGGISGQTKFTQQTFDESIRVRPGDLLFSWSGQPETSIDTFWWRGPEGWLNQHIFRVTSAQGIDRVFLYYLLKYLKPNFVRIARNKQTTGLGHVTRRDLKNIRAGYPPLPEQRAIARILGTLDDKIELNRRMNETLEAMAQALFKSWFVDFDPVVVNALKAGNPIPDKFAQRAVHYRENPDVLSLPEHILRIFPDRFVDSELGPIPEGWDMKAIGDIANVTSGKRPKIRYKERNLDATIEVWGGNGPMAYTDKALSKEPILLTGRVGTLGSVFRITAPCWPSDNTLILKGFSKNVYSFLYFWLKTINFSSLNRGSTQPLISQSDLQSQNVIAADEGVMDWFSSIVDAFFVDADCLERQNEILAAVRDTLLPKLISGELRVLDVEKILEVVGQ